MMSLEIKKLTESILKYHSFQVCFQVFSLLLSSHALHNLECLRLNSHLPLRPDHVGLHHPDHHNWFINLHKRRTTPSMNKWPVPRPSTIRLVSFRCWDLMGCFLWIAGVQLHPVQGIV